LPPQLRSFSLPGVVAAVGPDQFAPREASSYLVVDQPGPVAVLDRGGMNNDSHRFHNLIGSIQLWGGEVDIRWPGYAALMIGAVSLADKQHWRFKKSEVMG
jgi:hypothetical protein